MKKKLCAMCGKPFNVDQHNGAKKYCSEKCRDAAWKRMRKTYYRLHYKPRQTHETICKKCGAVFLGKWGAAYCEYCLTDGSKYMTQLLCNRMPGVQS